MPILFGIPIDELAEAHLTALVLKAREGDHLDVKAGTYENERNHEFLKDISALANHEAGHLLIGVDERDGLVVAIPGFRGNIDAELRRLSEIAQVGFNEPIPGLRMQPVKLAAGGFVIAIRVPQSPTGPHQIVTSGTAKCDHQYRTFIRSGPCTVEARVEQIMAIAERSKRLASAARDVGVASALPEMLLLRDGARLAWELVEGSELGEAIDKMYPVSPQKVADLVNSFLAHRRDPYVVRLYGKRPPSSVPLLIDEEQVRHHHWVEGTDTLQSDFAGRGVYMDVHVRRDDVAAHARARIAMHDRLFPAEVGTPAADVRLRFMWDDEAAPAAAHFGLKVFVVNRGPAGADVGDVHAEFRDAADDEPVFHSAVPRPMNTLFEPGSDRDVYALRLPDGNESRVLCGFVRWQDAAGCWVQLFRIQLRAHPAVNEHHFTQIGKAPWNSVVREDML